MVELLIDYLQHLHVVYLNQLRVMIEFDWIQDHQELDMTTKGNIKSFRSQTEIYLLRECTGDEIVRKHSCKILTSYKIVFNLKVSVWFTRLEGRSYQGCQIMKWFRGCVSKKNEIFINISPYYYLLTSDRRDQLFWSRCLQSVTVSQEYFL